MITFSNTANVNTVPAFEELLVKMRPHFEFFAKHDQKFRGDNYDECLQDLTCLAYDFYLSLVSRELIDRIFYTPIMKYSIGRFKEGRHFTGSNSVDVLADATRIQGRVEVESIELYNDKKHTWNECFVTDGRINVAHEVAFKIDCETWMNTFDWKRREILEAMIDGYSNQELSQRFQVSQGRISQHRREFVESWQEFRNSYDRKHRHDDFIDELIRMAEADERAATV